LREARDEIEVEGIRRSHESLQKAEFILHVFDVSEPLTGEDEKYLAEFAGKKRIIVRNKIDLAAKLELPEIVATDFQPAGSPGIPVRRSDGRLENRPNPQTGMSVLQVADVCCLSGKGIESLKDAIKNLVWSGEIKTEMLQVMINSRHQDALNRARDATSRTITALRAGATLELAAMDLRIAVNAVGEIVGKTANEDLLDMIFSQFCIGK
jgi:tRNA modification GTPase